MEGYGNENPGAFQSTRPLRGATLTGMTFREMFGISTHAPLAGRDSGGGTPSAVMVSISTHAPLAGRDKVLMRIEDAFTISTHAPLAGRDALAQDFQSQSSISTHAPLAGRDNFPVDPKRVKHPISTHAPLAGRDYRRRETMPL